MDQWLDGRDGRRKHRHSGCLPVAVFGNPDGTDWPRPSNEDDSLFFDMTGWEMGIANGQSDLFNISCIKEGTFDTGFMTIEVTREN